jgi:hypothetical protein
MAGTAHGIGYTAMVVVFIAQVAGNFLVAIQAKLRLRRFVEPFVALRALGFPLGMPGNYFPRGNDVIQRLGHQKRWPQQEH